MSIMSWKCDFTDEDEPKICVEYPNDAEVGAVIELIKMTVVRNSREGFEITCHGLCAKAPQGINWSVTVVFETVRIASIVADEMTRSYGPASG